jgi:hypothetical protein
VRYLTALGALVCLTAALRAHFVFVSEVGTSQFVCFSERNAAAFTLAGDGDPPQDDHDVWLGTGIIKPWIAHDRRAQAANHLYLDGHSATPRRDDAVIDVYPDKVVLTEDGTYP